MGERYCRSLVDPPADCERSGRICTGSPIVTLATEHNQPAVGSRSAGSLAALQLGMIINPHCHESGNDGTAGQQVAEGYAFCVGHGELGLLTLPLLHTIGQRSSLALVFNRDVERGCSGCLLLWRGLADDRSHVFEQHRHGLQLTLPKRLLHRC